MSDMARSMVLASFVGDALALGPHWEYDPAVLLARFGRISEYTAPPPGGYHAGRNPGELTHYGDQTLVLLQSVAESGGFDLDDFSRRWKALFREYSGYVDAATRMTLKIFDFGEGPENSGSNSNDLAGASRIAPLVYVLRDNLPALVAAVRAQTKMTHNHAQVIEAAEFFARAARAVLGGARPVEALSMAAEGGYASAPIGRWLDMGLASTGEDTVAAIGRFGRSCHIDEAMPGVIHLVAKYADALQTGLVQNVMAGGDSAARGLLSGMILGGAQGMDALPERWLTGLSCREAVARALDACDAAARGAVATAR